MKDARCTAAQALMRQYSANAYSNLVIEPLIAKNRLSPRDAAFASALFYTALERMLTLDHILRKYCSRPPERLDQTVRAALQLGLCQLLYMDGVDDYAAVNESVSLTKALGAARASGMVNGVLRSFLRDGKEIPPVRGGKAEQLVVEYSCPAWLIERWLSAYGEETALRMLAGSLGRPPIYLRANTVKTTARGARCPARGRRRAGNSRTGAGRMPSGGGKICGRNAPGLSGRPFPCAGQGLAVHGGGARRPAR